jgi:CheY-like chemotaxis protein
MTEAIAPASIAVIEDNPADLFLLQYALREHRVPHIVTLLRNGQEAMDYLKGLETQPADIPDLLIVDLNLPVYSGLELLVHIRKSARLARIKVAILTTSEAHADEAYAEALGAQLYLRKPTNLDDFIKMGAPLRKLLYDE